MDKIKFTNVQLAAAPIAWANDDMPEIGKEILFEQIISEIALAGYTGTEIGWKYPRNISTLQHALNLRQLQVVSAWFSSYLLTQPYEQVFAEFQVHVAFLKAMKAQVVVVSEQSFSIQQTTKPLFGSKPTIDLVQWQLLGTKLNALGAYALSQGLQLVFHHHMGTIVQTAAEVRLLLAHTNPQEVFLLFDTGHFQMAQEDSAALILEFGARIKHVHLKDIRSAVVATMVKNKNSFLEGVLMGMFTTPGTGVIDFGPIFHNLAKIGYQGWMVVEAEQDPLQANPFEYALNALKYIRELISY